MGAVCTEEKKLLNKVIIIALNNNCHFITLRLNHHCNNVFTIFLDLKNSNDIAVYGSETSRISSKIA